MLDGLRDSDLTHREACRSVLFKLWGELTAEERSEAASGQLSVRLIGVRALEERSGERIAFRLQVVETKIPGGMLLDGRDMQLFVDGKPVCDFSGETSYVTLVSSGTLTVEIGLPRSRLRPAVGGNAQIWISGRAQLGVTGQTLPGFTTGPSGPPPNGQPAMRAGEFSLPWMTPTRRALEGLRGLQGGSDP
jgi:hypothetical protein